MTTPILSIVLPGPRNPDGTEGKPLYDNGSGEPAEEAILSFALWCRQHDTLPRPAGNFQVTVEGYVCPGCNGSGGGFEDTYTERHGHSTIDHTCPCCGGEGKHDTEAEASYHQQGSVCCMPEPETRRRDYE